LVGAFHLPASLGRMLEVPVVEVEKLLAPRRAMELPRLQ